MDTLDDCSCYQQPNDWWQQTFLLTTVTPPYADQDLTAIDSLCPYNIRACRCFMAAIWHLGVLLTAAASPATDDVRRRARRAGDPDKRVGGCGNASVSQPHQLLRSAFSHRWGSQSIAMHKIWVHVECADIRMCVILVHVITGCDCSLFFCSTCRNCLCCWNVI